jgi:type II secretory ATPase GspE/PulE/Tfp pilus assembly ATPase PilB-like protein
METAVSAPQVLEELMRQAESARASDIHLQMIGARAEVAFRLDGVMTPISGLDDALAERVFGRIKYLARLKTYQQYLPQDGRIDRSELKTQSDVRVATYPTVTGEKIVLRLFQQSGARAWDELGFDAAVLCELDAFLRRPSGLLLLTGPAGSGKTTTIHACLQRLAAGRARHIITIEDPVEQVLPGIMQTEVNEARGLTFACAARHLLRQDPEVLAVGEIRDEDTARLVVRAALTGHLMISTLHAGSCRGVLERLLTLCPERSAVLSALELILNQRLLRRVCARCGGSGCAECLQTGYRGRGPVAEWFRVTATARAALSERGWEAVEPVPPLVETARRWVQDGLTNETEFQRVFGA